MTKIGPLENQGSRVAAGRRYENIGWLADRFGTTEQAAYAMIRRNVVGGILKLGRRILIDVEKFEAWAASQTT